MNVADANVESPFAADWIRASFSVCLLVTWPQPALLRPAGRVPGGTGLAVSAPMASSLQYDVAGKRWCSGRGSRVWTHPLP